MKNNKEWCSLGDRYHHHREKCNLEMVSFIYYKEGY